MKNKNIVSSAQAELRTQLINGFKGLDTPLSSIEEAAFGLWPEGKLPHGESKKIANEAGCSPARVSQVLAAMGFVVVKKDGTPQKKGAGRPKAKVAEKAEAESSESEGYTVEQAIKDIASMKAALGDKWSLVLTALGLRE